MIPSFVIDEEGNAVPSPDFFSSGWLLSHFDMRLVAETERDDKRVSTVFIVTPSQFDDEGRPFIWETMTNDAGAWVDQKQYVTLKEAVAGHKATVLSVFGEAAPTTRWGKLVFETKVFQTLRRSVWERLLDPDDLGLPEDPVIYYIGNQKCAICRRRGHNRRSCPKLGNDAVSFEDQLLLVIRADIDLALNGSDMLKKRALLRRLLGD